MRAGGGTSDGGSTGALHGTLPSNVTASDVTTAYNKWKATYVKSCASGGSYVTNPQDNNNGYSEGIGYGMLLAVANGDQTTFDALYTFYSEPHQQQRAHGMEDRGVRRRDLECGRDRR